MNETPQFAKIELAQTATRTEAARRQNRFLRLTLGALALFAATYATLNFAGRWSAQHQLAERRLVAFNLLRHDRLEEFITAAREDVQLWSRHPLVVNDARAFFADWAAMSENERDAMAREFRPGGQLDTDATSRTPAERVYIEHYRRLQPELLEFIQTHEFYDLFLFTPEGELAFTVVRESDFGNTIGEAGDPLFETELEAVASMALASSDPDAVFLSDFAPYAPSAGAMAAFLATPLVDADGQRLGVFAVQLNLDIFDDLLTFNEGLGETGFSLVVGEDGRARNSIPLLGEKGLAMRVVPSNPSLDAAMNGNQASGEMRGGDGVPRFVAARPLQIAPHNWVVMTEMDVAEVRRPLWPYLWLYLASLVGILVSAVLSYRILRSETRPPRSRGPASADAPRSD